MNALRRQIRSMLQVEPREGGFTAAFKVGADLAILCDHFRDAPILPGVCMVQAVLLAAANALGLPDLTMRVLKNAKITRPVRPGDQVQISGEMTTSPQGDITIKASFTTESGQRCADFSIIARPLAPSAGGQP
jgi:3-hydroxymyristoyl/3-hydroxydecanoyl-(acyl carrier protein) dehydratase